MTIKPCGNAQTDKLALRESAHHIESRREPLPVFIRHRLGSQHLYSLLRFLLRATGQPSTQMGSLHRTGTTAAQHVEPLFGEPFAKHDDTGEHRVGAQQRMTAHQTNASPAIVFSKECVECRVNAMIVKCSSQRLVHVLCILTHRHVVLIYLPVVAIHIRRPVFLLVVRRLVASIEVVGSIETRPRYIVRHALQPFAHAFYLLQVLIDNHW